MAQDTLDSIILQLAAGFGQGAGTTHSTGEALLTARDAYGQELGPIVSTWSDYALQTIEYSRTLGRLAAANAAGQGRCVIERADVEYALGRVQLNSVEPLGPCRITNTISERRKV